MISMGVNLRLGVSDEVYSLFVDGLRDEFIVQNNDYFVRRLKDKKYLFLVNDELEKPEVRFKIESIVDDVGGAKEDVYGTFIPGSFLRLKLLKRVKTS